MIQSPPHDEEAERTLLGGLLSYGRKIEAIEAIVKADDLYDPKHEAIFGAMDSLRQRSENINLVTVRDEMRRQNTLQRLNLVGAEAYLADLANGVAGPEGVESCARLIREKSTLRRVILEAGRISALAYRDDRPVSEVVDEAQGAMFRLGDLTPRRDPKSFAQVLHTSLTTLREKALTRSAITGVPSGLEGLDELTGGFQPGQLIVVAGRPGMGKSAFAESVALHAIERNHPGLIFSMEMTDDELGQRAMSAEAGVDGANMRTGMLREIEWVRLSSAVTRLRDRPLWVDDDSRQDLHTISTTARRWRKQPQVAEKLGFIVLDYMQLVSATSGRKYHSREREVAEISSGLKALAKELRLPIIALAALNRDCEKRTDKRPLMSDLKESSSIEADANLVLLLYRDEVYHAEKTECEPGVAEIIIGKNRSGSIGTVRAKYIKEQTRFANLSQRAA